MQKKDIPGRLDEANPQIEIREQPKKMTMTDKQPVVAALPYPSQFSKLKKEESQKEILKWLNSTYLRLWSIQVVKMAS